MNDFVFLLVIAFFLLLILYSANKRKKNAGEKTVERLKSEFGRPADINNSAYDANILGGYLEFIKTVKDDETFVIDDISFSDLNLDSVFRRINTCNSQIGEEYLFARIHCMYMNSEVARGYRKGISYILEDENRRIYFQTILSDLGKVKKAGVFEILKALKDAEKAAILNDCIIDALILISFISIFIFPGPGMLFFLLMLFASIFTYFKGKEKMEENLAAFVYLIKMIRAIQKIEAVTESTIIKDSNLSRLTKRAFLLPVKSGSASDPVSLLLDYVRLIFHVDLICYNKRLSLIRECGEDIIRLYEYIGELDSQIAMASFIASLDYVCEPEYLSHGMIFDGLGLYHPLTDNPVSNDLNAERSVLITGSNASGKSTFLRTVGINAIFAESFGFAFARSLALSPMRLYTSMALKDNILGKESYYIVESKSLKRIIDASKQYDNILCIVDEVLKGTNTIERIAASYSILKYFSELSILTFVATHDSELCTMLKDIYDMYYFSELISENNIYFPFEIKKGIAGEGNAVKLLEILEFDKVITQRAMEKIDGYRAQGKW